MRIGRFGWGVVTAVLLLTLAWNARGEGRHRKRVRMPEHMVPGNIPKFSMQLRPGESYVNKETYEPPRNEGPVRPYISRFTKGYRTDKPMQTTTRYRVVNGQKYYLRPQHRPR